MTQPSPVPHLIVRGNRRGIALLLTLLLALLVVSLAIGVLLMTSTTTLVTRFHINEALYANFASAGLEQARDTLNGSPNLLLDGAGFVTLESNVPVRDASNTVIPGVTRSLYAGLTGNLSGRGEGVFATVLSVIRTARGPVVIRRSDLRRKSFANYARFYNTWPSGNFARNDVIFGPVHSNQGMSLSSGSPGATFWGQVTSVNSISNQGNGNWNGGVQTGVSAIPFPSTSSINTLENVASPSGMVINGDDPSSRIPDTRLEFIAIDLNGDGDTADENEGYMRVFRAFPGGSSGQQAQRRAYVNARNWENVGSWPGSPAVTINSDPNMTSPNCGGRVNLTSIGSPTWLSADSLIKLWTASYPGDSTTALRDSVRMALRGDYRRCYLGGDRMLTGGLWTTTTQWGEFMPYTGWGGAPPAALAAAIAATGTVSSTTPNDVASTFWPLSPSQNANFRGVIFVRGSVAVSGRLRGRVTLVAQGNIVLVDDITYVQAPNTDCTDILGLINTGRVWLSNNSINTPFRVSHDWTVAFDDTPNETYHAFVLTKQEVEGDDIGYDGGPEAPEDCGGATRGCRSFVGGIIQQEPSSTRNGNVGWEEQDTYDQCGAILPPPYFPTTGTFTKYRYFEIDPVGFTPTAWFAANQ